tara:strand:- start:839 stop:970 length:132 start_codon:yes stop_codon:yes gene_type:complete
MTYKDNSSCFVQDLVQLQSLGVVLEVQMKFVHLVAIQEAEDTR